MGPIQTVRERVKAGDWLLTPSQSKPFTVETIDDAGVVLLLGEKRARTQSDSQCWKVWGPRLPEEVGFPLAASMTPVPSLEHSTPT